MMPGKKAPAYSFTTDTPAVIQNITNAISQLDQMPSLVTQVRIEAKIAKVANGALKDIGVRWFVQGKDIAGSYYSPGAQSTMATATGRSNNPLGNELIGNTTGNSGGSGRQFVGKDGKFDRRVNIPAQVPLVGQLALGVLSGGTDVGILLDALIKDNKAEMLANPSILVANHRLAEIKMADEYPYTETSATFGTVTSNVKFMDLGIKMQVTPHVFKDNQGPYVQLELKPEVSSTSGISNGVPVRNLSSYSGVANVRDGQTLIIGGIVMNNEAKINQRVPVLGKIPVMGNLFKRKETNFERNELMIFVTPVIHESPESVTWDRMVNLTGAAKSELPVPSSPMPVATAVEASAAPAPVAPQQESAALSGEPTTE